ncbi:MAG: hypothetical protein H6829_09580 [Planctomycetes bacterium]|nr:hypothetical protein [Planctomycetota bacterium]MCB9912627.1 hypothetical protein [Planctomycetota bacterium]HRV80245.1 hypothetical protein [Planctomycetota bacterium]
MQTNHPKSVEEFKHRAEDIQARIDRWRIVVNERRLAEEAAKSNLLAAETELRIAVGALDSLYFREVERLHAYLEASNESLEDGGA